MAIASSRKRITADEYVQLADDDSLREKRVELVEGEIVEMSPIGTRHEACVDRQSVAPELLPECVVPIVDLLGD